MSSSSEQQPEQAPQVQVTKEHEWLRRMVGEWTYEGNVTMGPDAPPAKFAGTESVRSIGDIWVVGEGKGDMPGCSGEGLTMVTLGFNPQTSRFVGSWVGSMMNHMWVYDGWLEGNTLTLESQGPDFSDPTKISTYRDVAELVDDDHRVLRSQGQGPDGSWFEFMRCDYYRAK